MSLLPINTKKVQKQTNEKRQTISQTTTEEEDKWAAFSGGHVTIAQWNFLLQDFHKCVNQWMTFTKNFWGNQWKTADGMSLKPYHLWYGCFCGQRWGMFSWLEYCGHVREARQDSKVILCLWIWSWVCPVCWAYFIHDLLSLSFSLPPTHLSLILCFPSMCIGRCIHMRFHVHRCMW